MYLVTGKKVISMYPRAFKESSTMATVPVCQLKNYKKKKPYLFVVYNIIDCLSVESHISDVNYTSLERRVRGQKQDYFTVKTIFFLISLPLLGKMIISISLYYLY